VPAKRQRRIPVDSLVGSVYPKKLPALLYGTMNKLLVAKNGKSATDYETKTQNI
jgi:hypothetical protein